MAYDYMVNMADAAKARYNTKLECLGIQCPYQTPAGSWTNDPTKWPELQWPEVYDYLVSTPGDLS